ncbi:MAG: ParB/RepB/Spo0J family partition protein [Thermoproteota archaeon]
MKKIRPPKYALRDDLVPLDELMVSIKEKGLLQPIIVRPLEDGFEVVAGNRRLEACKRLGWRKIPCHIIELNDKEAYEVSLIENVQHKSLNPIEEAKAFRKYVIDHGWGSISELAKRIGKHHSYISRRMSLLDLPPEIQEQIVRRRTTPSTALELLSLDSDKRMIVSDMIFNGNFTKREVRCIVKRIKNCNCDIDETFIRTPYSSYSLREEHERAVDNVFRRCIACLKVALIKMSDVTESLRNDWITRELLIPCRRSVDQWIDTFIKLRKKSKHYQVKKWINNFYQTTGNAYSLGDSEEES